MLPEISLRHTTHYGYRAMPPKWIIIHSTESGQRTDCTGTLNYLLENARRVSSDFLVCDKSIWQLVDYRREYSHHAGSESSRLPDGTTGSMVNQVSIGIECYNRTGYPVSAMVEGHAIELVSYLCRELGIPPSNVLGHREVDPSRRSDPTGINMHAFRQSLKEAPSHVRRDKLRWHLEETARRARAAGDTDVHDWLYRHIPDILRMAG